MCELYCKSVLPNIPNIRYTIHKGPEILFQNNNSYNFFYCFQNNNSYDFFYCLAILGNREHTHTEHN